VIPTVALMVLMLSGAAPREVELRPGETLVDIARRELGDASAADELRALNGLSPGKVRVGTKLRLPGEERDRAVSALGAARNAVVQTDAGTVSESARQRLAEAEQLFTRAEYARAAAAADEAWRLVSEREATGTAFTVEVNDAGTTRVTSHAGTPVRVEAQGVQKAITAGQAVSVARGKPPTRLESPSVPAPVSPRDNARLKLKADRRGELGPVRLTWRKSARAAGYVVELQAEGTDRKGLKLETDDASLTLPRLPPGRYLWTVRALGAGALNSEPSAPRRFELAVDPLKLEVREPTWK
jgi:LysM domain